MTARSYWQSSARDMIKTHHDHNGRATEANKEIVPPLDPGRLNAISEKAYKAALQLAALAAGVTMDSLDKKYQEWCSSGRFTTKSDGLGDENMDDDQEDGAPGPDADDEENEGQDFLNQLQAEAALGQEEAEEEQKGQDENPSEVLVMDLRRVPDKDMLRVCLHAFKGQFDYEQDIEPEELKDISRTLFQTLWGLGEAASEEEILDGVWRLLMYLRHWRGGSDRDWISNPRMCRKRSKALNWHQWLDPQRITRDHKGMSIREPINSRTSWYIPLHPHVSPCNSVGFNVTPHSLEYENIFVSGMPFFRAFRYDMLGIVRVFSTFWGFGWIWGEYG